MSWKRALDTIHTRIELRLDGCNGSLRHWGMVIGRTYDEFQANFPVFEADSFASLVMSSDGRSEDSSFPNLVVPGERERYGL